MSKYHAINHSTEALKHTENTARKLEQPPSRAQDICMVCGQRKRQGIRVIEQWICQPCETEIVNTEVEEKKYAFFIQRLRKLWLK